MSPEKRKTSASAAAKTAGNQGLLVQQLARHTIEEELLHGYPRLIKSEDLPFKWYYWFLWLSFLTVGTDFGRHSGIPWLGTIAFCTANVFMLCTFLKTLLQIGKRFRERHRIPFLRYGKAVPAIVTDITPGKIKTKIEFAYVDPFGEIQIRSPHVPTQRLKRYGFAVGNTFTLLISRENDQHVLPYFLACEYQVAHVKATTASQRVSAQLSIQASQIPTQPYNALGAIEPELLGVRPRTIQNRVNSRRAWWYSFALASLGTILALFWKNITNVHLAYLPMCLAMIYLVSFIKRLTHTSNISIHSPLLQNGIAVRAKVISIKMKHNFASRLFSHPVLVQYEYETKSRDIHHQSILVKPQRLRQLGITAGTTFTVLYDIENPAISIPDFAIEKVEIADALGAKVTLP
ncbi:MAG: hypothetical protein EOP06_23820, partial [Proteobacteria bacterium]